MQMDEEGRSDISDVHSCIIKALQKKKKQQLLFHSISLALKASKIGK